MKTCAGGFDALQQMCSSRRRAERCPEAARERTYRRPFLYRVAARRAGRRPPRGGACDADATRRAVRPGLRARQLRFRPDRADRRPRERARRRQWRSKRWNGWHIAARSVPTASAATVAGCCCIGRTHGCARSLPRAEIKLAQRFAAGLVFLSHEQEAADRAMRELDRRIAPRRSFASPAGARFRSTLPSAAPKRRVRCRASRRFSSMRPGISTRPHSSARCSARAGSRRTRLPTTNISTSVTLSASTIALQGDGAAGRAARRSIRISRGPSSRPARSYSTCASRPTRRRSWKLAQPFRHARAQRRDQHDSGATAPGCRREAASSSRHWSIFPSWGRWSRWTAPIRRVSTTCSSSC